MREPNPSLSQQIPPKPITPIAESLQVPRNFVFAAFALLVCFGMPLYHWVRFALQSDLYSYVLLVPFVSAYLFKVGRGATVKDSSRAIPGVLLLLGGTATGAYIVDILTVSAIHQQDALALSTSAFVLLFAGMIALFLNGEPFRRAVFPLVFLLFMIPFPLAIEHGIETFLQRGSAPPAYWFFKIAGTPVFREDMIFQLPGITLQIAPECSGIRSSLVLFMTSLIAGHLFLRSPLKRAALALFVIPLALVRNGLRVFTIGELCVRVGPHMIDSDIHHRGGPIFFALSLIPFFLLLFFLIKSDRSAELAKRQTVSI